MGVLPASQYGSVTPYVGVWIETFGSKNRHQLIESHPTWVCGLKQQGALTEKQIKTSHPTWVCGLKLAMSMLSILLIVTPYVGVWIETYDAVMYDESPDVTPYVGVWIETLLAMEV